MNTDKGRTDAIDQASIWLAGATALTGFTRVLFVRPLAEGINDTTLKFFAAAGALLLLRKIKSMSFGDYKAEFAEAVEKANEALEEAKTASSMARNLGTKPEDEPSSRALSGVAFAPDTTAGTGPRRKSVWDMQPGKVEDDPWKGVFGGQSEANHRRLRAEVVATKGDDEWFRIHLWVESTDESGHPLTGRVRFFIHDTFANDKPFIAVRDGQAELRLSAYGAFTVGVLADEGATKLELDLSQDRSFPRLFRNR